MLLAGSKVFIKSGGITYFGIVERYYSNGAEHPRKDSSSPWFCQVTRETFSTLILSTLIKQEEDIQSLSMD